MLEAPKDTGLDFAAIEALTDYGYRFIVIGTPQLTGKDVEVNLTRFAALRFRLTLLPLGFSFTDNARWILTSSATPDVFEEGLGG
ncbi:MAG: hypothetical protein HQL35_14955, partial [Alphaproteobacteria bacterium]|nr:hypothetical protein [Alphaproteobacteria bacterium]